MDIIISNSDKRPIYEQIYEAIKSQILSGKIEEKEALPSIRLLAKELRISVITTKRAYDELEKDGFIEVVPGKGSFVKKRNQEILKEEVLKQVEDKFIEAIDISKYLNMSYEDLEMILKTLYYGG